MDYAPIKLTPVIKNYIWGGTKLIADFNKKAEDIAAESWELSTHPDGESIVSTGIYAGCTLSEYIKRNGIECIGSNAAKFEFFPILIKLIDAKDNLSIQVHPDDEYALRVEKEYGKTEMWYIVDCDENSYIYYGLNRKISKEELAERIKNNSLPEVLNKVPVKKGDVFFIPAGTIHAICSGILICEVQQNSNTTYRVYDYDRRDKNGNPRDLHIDKAIEVASLAPPPVIEQKDGNILAKCKYFTAEKIICEESTSIPINTNSFRSFIVTDGNGTITINGSAISVNKGDSIFIPAQNGPLEFAGKLEGILSYV